MRIYTFVTEKIEDQWLSMVYNDSYDYLVLRNHHAYVCKMYKAVSNQLSHADRHQQAIAAGLKRRSCTGRRS
jgi:hypothetical protein